MEDNYPRFKAAAIQAAPVFLDRAGTISKACKLVKEAASEGAELAVFPETYVPGYPHWFTFMEAREGMARFSKRLFENSVVIPGPETDLLCAVAKEARCHVAIGLTERRARTLGTLYNTQLFIDDNGNVLGKHRKVMPTGVERLVHAQGDGSTMKVYPTRLGEIGGLICGEHTNMLACFALLALGEKVHAASWPAFPAKNEAEVIRTKTGMEVRSKYYAFAGKVFVVNSCGVLDDHTLEAAGAVDQGSSLVSRGGGSSIVGPDGRYIAGPAGDKEEIVYGEIDLSRVPPLKAAQDITGHYNRFDIFKFKMVTTENEPIELDK